SRSLVLAPTASFGHLQGDLVEAQVAGRSLPLPLVAYHLLLEFTRPRPLRDAFEAVRGDVSLPGFRRIVDHLAKVGLLVEPSPPPSISTVLTGAIGDNPRLRRALRAALTEGKMCVIRDAFDVQFARGVAEVLQTESRWEHRQGTDEAFFHY